MPSQQKKRGGGPKTSHAYKNIREMLCADANAGTVLPMPLAANSTSIVCLNPLSLVTMKLASGPTATLATMESAHLRWLNVTATNFKQYRILRAVLIVVGTQASTATGNFSVFSSPDYSDVFLGTAPSYSTTGPGTSVASLATKDQRFPLDIDTSWKKVSSRLCAVSSDQVTVTPITTVDDASFCSVAVSNNSTAALGIAYIEYDVEFRGPLNISLQA